MTINDMKWQAIGADCVPVAHQPVLLRLKNRHILTTPRSRENRSDDDASFRSLLIPGQMYGWQIGILVWAKDGFQRSYPLHFKTLGWIGDLPEVGRATIALSEVTHWAELT
jgi:hypothetical protein